MRRYATAFVEAVKRVKGLDSIKLARVHDVIGRNALMVTPTSRVIRGDDISDSLIKEGERLSQEKVHQAIGKVPQELQTAYQILLGLSTHDISAMRELIGIPKGVLYAAQRSGGMYITAAFDYGDFVCHFETGIDDVPRFDCHLEVYGKSQTLRVEYQSPYVRHQATTLNIIHAKPDSGLHSEVIQPNFEDNFTQEWKAFYHTITTGSKPKTSPEDYRQDLELFSQMMEKIREGQLV
jgi:predicted dehydrogenase